MPSRWSVPLLVLALLVGCSSPGAPYRAVLLTSGQVHPTTDSQVVEQVRRGLEDLGIDVARDVDPLPEFDVDAARRRAKKAHASHAVVLELSSEAERPGVLAGTQLYAVKLTTHVVNESGEHPEVAPYAMEFAYEKATAMEVEQTVLDTWVTGAVPHVVDAMVYSPQLSKLLSGDGSHSDLIAAGELMTNQELIDARHDAVAEYDAYCEAEGARLAAFAKAEGITCYGNPCGQYALLGVDSADRPIVQDVTSVPLFTVPPKRKGYWWEPPERIVAIAPDRSEQVLFRSGNFYGLGHVRPGARVGSVETFSSKGSGVIYGFDLEKGSTEQITLLAPGVRTQFSSVSPGGEAAMWCVSAGGGCFYDGGAGAVRLQDYTWARWAAPTVGLRVVGQLRQGGLAIDDPTAAEPSRPIRVKGTLQDVVRVDGDRISVVLRDDGGDCSLVHLDAAANRVDETLAMPRCIWGPTLLADGRLVGTAEVTLPGDVPGDQEVVVWEPGAKSLFQLTTGSFMEELVHPSTDGTRLFFNRRLEPPPEAFDTGVYRRAVCELELPPL